MKIVTKSKRIALGMVPLVALAIAGCGSSDGAVDPRLEPLSPVARDAFGAVITESQPLRITTATGSNTEMMGQTETMEADLSKPTQLIEVDGDGEIHQILSAQSQFDPNPESVEVWRAGDEMIWSVPDGYSENLASAADAFKESGEGAEVIESMVDLLQPGEFRVDLAKVTDATSIDERLSSQLAGNNLDEMFEQLALQFDDAEPVNGDDNTRELTTQFGEMQGADLAEQMLDGIFGGGALPIEQSVLTDFVDDMMASPMTVMISLDDQGRVVKADSVIEMTEAMKSLMTAAFANAGDAMPQEQLDSFLDGLQLEITQVTEIEYDDSIEVEIPSGVTDDRTDAFIALGEAIGRAGAGATTDDSAPSGADTTVAA